MSYQVLARKYRPQSFQEVVGQIHITQTLQNALAQKRLHHAYLFTGARGIGKTTVARIFAKALNCEKGVLQEPCGSCSNCTDVMQGRSLDVQEIDGASHTGVDDVRQIRDQIAYLPTKSRYKIYIIDEVHMLSASAFNALLKTLEEPPPHVIFMFATTEPHKIPATILSRCQRYDFRRISVPAMVATLEEIAKKEKISVTQEALHQIAQESQGSLRDGESLLDQAIAFANGPITYDILKDLLGFLDRTQLHDLLRSVLQKNKKAALEKLNDFYQSGVDLNRLAQDLVIHFRNLLLIRSLNESPAWLDIPKEELEFLQSLSESTGGGVTFEELDQLFQLAMDAVENIARSPFPKALFEVLLVRMTQVSQVMPIEEILEKLSGMEKSAPVPVLAPTKSWDDFVAWLSKSKPQFGSILAEGSLVSLQNNVVTLNFASDSLHKEMILEEDRKKQFQELLKNFFGRPINLQIISKTSPLVENQADLTAQKKVLKESALRHASVQEAANILGAVVEDVKTKLNG